MKYTLGTLLTSLTLICGCIDRDMPFHSTSLGGQATEPASMGVDPALFKELRLAAKHSSGR